MNYLKQSTTTTIQLGPFLDDTDGKTAETGLTISSTDVYLSKAGAAFANPNDANAATHDRAGWYRKQLNTTDTNTIGRFIVEVQESGALPVWREFMILPANVFDSLVSGSDNLEVDAIAISGDTTAANNLELDYDGTGYDKANSTIGTTTTNTDMVTEPPTAAAVADQVWDEAKAGHVAGGSFGEEVQAHALSSEISALNDPTAAAVADQVWEEAIADHSGTAGSTAELLQDIDNEVDEIHTQIDAIAVTGSALNQIAESDTLAVGSETGGTYVSTQASDDTRHIITAATNEIDIYYQFDIGTSGVPVGVQIEGYLKEGAPAGGDTIDLYAYDWVGTAWELIHPAIFTGITGDVDETAVHTLFARHVGTAGNDGLVRIRFQAASLEAGTTLNIDQLFVTFAESIAADVTSILADTDELQTDWTNGGRLDLILDDILADTAELQTDWVNGGRLDLIVDAILADTNELQTDWTNGGRLDLIIDAILADTGTDGVVISTATAQAIADEILKRGVSNTEDTADTTSLTAIILAILESSISSTTWTIRKTGGTTFATKTVTLDAAADPITAVT